MEMLIFGAAAVIIPLIGWLSIKGYRMTARLRRNRKRYLQLIKAALLGAAGAYASVGVAALMIYTMY